MSAILGYARVSTGDQDVAGQTIRLEQAGATKVFTDVMSGKSMNRPGRACLFEANGLPRYILIAGAHPCIA